MWRRRAALCLLALAVHATQMAAGRKVLGEAGSARSAAATAATAAVTLPAAALSSGDTNAASSAGTEVELRIINGNEVTTGDFDFMAALLQDGRFFCGGALLDNTTVLTAAHCLVDTGIIYAPQSLTVWTLGTEYPVAQVFAHPGYSSQTIPEDNQDLSFDGSLHDIGVIKLAPPGISGSPPTVLLPTADAWLEPGEQLQISGWGTTEDGSPSNVLKYAAVAYLPPYNCPSDYDDVLCGGDTGQNTCNGDSGGPLLVRNTSSRAATVVGVTSHGPDCLSGPKYAYGYYTDVRRYLDAIAAWQQGMEFEPASSETSGGSSSDSDIDSSSSVSTDDSSSDTGSSDTGSDSQKSPPASVPDPVIWQPVPGWDWQASSASSTWTWQELFCQVFLC